MNNGLFGYINGAFVPSTELLAAQSHISKVSSQRLDIFRCVFSFTPETTAESGHIYAKATLARLYLQSKEPSLHTQAETILNENIKQAKGEQKNIYISVTGLFPHIAVFVIYLLK